MTTNNRHEVTEKLIAANRRNAEKSTGPKTEEGKRWASRNHYKHGLYAEPDMETRRQMLRAGEDPDLLAHFQREFTEAWQPSNAMEAAVVADLARLYVDKALLEKSARGILVEQADLEEAREAPINPQRLEAVGYFGIACQESFDQGQKLLQRLTEKVERQDWAIDDELIRIFRLLSGNPLLDWGKNMLRNFKNLAAMKPEIERPGVIEGEKQFIVDQIAEMKWDLYKQEMEYRSGKEAAALEAQKTQCLPGRRPWNIVQRQQARLDRMIDSKAKLLMRLKKQWPVGGDKWPEEDEPAKSEVQETAVERSTGAVDDVTAD